MKLLKIGSSTNCNVVLNSQFVSSLHAEMLLTDDGRIYLEDKNSLNGTYVGSRKLTPNEKTQVQRGDLIKFGDAELNWTKVPVYKGPKAGEEWFNIGSGEKCEIIVSGPFIGRYNSILMIKDKKAYIMDNESRNGTMVDGKKIAPNKFVPIKKGTSVICGDTDITEQLQEYIPGRFGWLKPLLITLGTAAVLTGVFFLAKGLFKPSFDTKAYTNAVVYVDACYYYVAEIENSPIPKEIWNGKIRLNTKEDDYHRYCATAFFVDDNGVMATNRHVARPWDYSLSAERSQAIVRAREELAKLLGGIESLDYNNADAQFEQLSNTTVGKALCKVWAAAIEKNGWSGTLLSSINRTLSALINANIKLEGEIEFISVGYRGQYYDINKSYGGGRERNTGFDECRIMAVSDNEEKDVALLQLSNPHTPPTIGTIISMEDIYEGKIEPGDEELMWVGYPKGLKHGIQENMGRLEPVQRKTWVSMNPDRYSFEFSDEPVGGASGSPVFNPKTGKLYGVVWGSWTEAAAYGQACQAKYIKELYDQQLDVINR